MALIRVTYADRRVRTSHVWHDFASLGIPDEDIRMHYSLWVADTDDGPLLVDTGFHVPESYWVGDAIWRPVPDAIAAVGIDPETVRHVVLTHYHFDHAGHVGLYPNAIVHASRREHEHWVGSSDEALRAAFVTPEHLEAILGAESQGRLDLTEGRAEITPGVTLIPAPGHTPGQLAVLIESGSGSRLLASDSAHFAEQLDLGWHFFAHTDADAADRSIGELKRIATATGAEIVPGHDARVRDRYPAVEGAAAGFASVLLH